MKTISLMRKNSQMNNNK